MKLALIFLSVLLSLSLRFGAQETPPATCRGTPLPITILPGPKMQSIALPLRFGAGTRPMPLPWVNSFPSKTGFRLVIKNRDEFTDFWKRLLAPVPPDKWVPLPEVDFSKEMVVVAAMGERPSSGYAVIIDGACKVDGQVEVFVSNLEGGVSCGEQLAVVTAPADAVRIPQTELPIVFREIQVGCNEWHTPLQSKELKTWR
jgi:hypothetical protein